MCFFPGYRKSRILANEFTGIAQGARHALLFKPCFGVLQQHKYIYPKYCPMTMELEFDTDEIANVIIPDANAPCTLR